MKAVALLLVVPALVVAWLSVRDARLERRLGTVASAIAHRDVDVDCQGLVGSLLDAQARHGEVRFDAAGAPEPRIFLTRATCSELRRLGSPGTLDDLACLHALDWSSRTPLVPGDGCYERAAPVVYAVLVLAHEAYHTAGVVTESTANCYAIQAMAFAATRLGLPGPDALAAARAMTALAPLQRGGYATSECVSGSGLDLAPSTWAFPSELPLAAPPRLPSGAPR